jgi:hypothetical protein
MDLARAPRRAPLTARKKGSGYENGSIVEGKRRHEAWRQLACVPVHYTVVYGIVDWNTRSQARRQRNDRRFLIANIELVIGQIGILYVVHFCYQN